MKNSKSYKGKYRDFDYERVKYQKGPRITQPLISVFHKMLKRLNERDEANQKMKQLNIKKRRPAVDVGLLSKIVSKLQRAIVSVGKSKPKRTAVLETML